MKQIRFVLLGIFCLCVAMCIIVFGSHFLFVRAMDAHLGDIA